MPNSPEVIQLENAPLVLVRPDGTTIKFNEAGAVEISGNMAVKVDRPFDEKIGQVMESGLIYAGISPDTNAPFYVRPQDEFATEPYPGRAHGEAMIHAREVEAHGKLVGTFRLASRGELNHLLENPAMPGFSSAPHPVRMFYWTSESVDDKRAYFQGTRDRSASLADKSHNKMVRLVCDMA